MLIVYGFARYRARRWIDVWSPPVWTRHLALLLVLARDHHASLRPTSPATSSAMLKHPMLVGVKLWALAHLHRQRRSRLDHPVRLDPGLGGVSTASRSSAAPIPARRRSRSAARATMLMAVVVGTLLYLALGLWFHPYVIGVPAFGA